MVKSKIYYIRRDVIPIFYALTDIGKKVGFALTASFCTFQKIILQYISLYHLVCVSVIGSHTKSFDVIPVVCKNYLAQFLFCVRVVFNQFFHIIIFLFSILAKIHNHKQFSKPLHFPTIRFASTKSHKRHSNIHQKNTF